MLRARLLPELGNAETALLCHAVLRSAAAVDDTGMPEDGVLDWDLLLDAAERHRLGPLVATGLLHGKNRVRAPAEALERMRNILNVELARSVVRLHHVDEIGAIAFRKRLDACLLKGAAFAPTLYSSPALRPMADLDVLVRASDFEEWSIELESIGYVPVDRADHATCFRTRETGTFLELHEELTSQASLLGLSADLLLDRAVPLDAGDGIRLTTLSWEDHLIHLCLHASFQHGFRQPAVNAWDARCITERKDFDGHLFLERSRGARLAPWVYGGLSLCEAVFPGSEIRALREELESAVSRRIVRNAQRFRAQRLLAPDTDAVFGAPVQRLAWTGPGLFTLLVLFELSKPRTRRTERPPWGRARRIMQLVRNHGFAVLSLARGRRPFLQMSATPRFTWRGP